MLQSKLIGDTHKEWPSEATLRSHGILLKGGYIKQMASGIYTLLPLAKKVVDKIQRIIKEEMDAIGCQEILMPVVATRKLWEMSGRYNAINDELLRFKDRNDSDMVLSMTHEEAVVFMAMTEGKTYNKYPFSVYQIQTKFRDEARPRGGLIRVREFTMKDAYSFHTSEESLDKTYDDFYNAYNKIYKRAGIKEVIAVKSDTGMMGGSMAHEYMLLCDAGEDKIVTCKSCNYSANMEVAYTDTFEIITDNVEDIEKIYTPNIKTIDDLSKFINEPIEHLGKAVIYTRLDNNKPVIVFLRADREVNESKLTNYIGTDIIPRKPEEADNIIYGFVGPVGLNEDEVTIIYDISLKDEKSIVFGANEVDYHYKGVNIKRDVGEKEYIDVSKVKIDDVCPICHKKELNISNGIEVGNIFKLGTKYTKSMNMTYTDENGEEKFPIMGCYGIGVGRLMASVLEARATEKETNWPVTIAPFDIHILPLDYTKNAEIRKITDNIYSKLSKNYDILVDDRNKSAGVKFADADLVGAPIRIIIGNKNLQENNVEIKNNITKETILVNISDLNENIEKIYNDLTKEVD